MRQLEDGSWENSPAYQVEENLSLPKLFAQRAKRSPHAVVAEEKNQVGSWVATTVEQLNHQVEQIARGLYVNGLRPGDKFAILVPTSLAFLTFDLAAMTLGAVTVPIYESDSASQIKHILKDAGVKAAVTLSAQQADLLVSVKPRSLKHVYCLDRGAMSDLSRMANSIDLTTIRNLRDELELSDLATLVYTSGTTGTPKGVMLSHSNFVRSLTQGFAILPNLIGDPNSRTLLFLPVAHVLARFVMYAICCSEGRLGLCPNTNSLVQDIQSFEPTMMLVVPRVLEKVYNSASATAGGSVKGKIFSWAAKQARDFSEATAYPPEKSERSFPFIRPEKPAQKLGSRQGAYQLPESTVFSAGPSLGLRVSETAADLVVLRKIRKILGPNLQTVICGGAPLSVDLANFFRGLGITLLQGYGLTETTGPITVELPSDYPPNSVGYLWPGNSMKLAEDGELLLKGINVTSGYYNLPKETEKVFKDGWFYSGDLAEIDDDGRLRIVGRKKELIVTAGGKNVSPEILEKSLSSHPLIGQIIIVGDDRPFVGALITLDPEMLPNWLKNKELPPLSMSEAANLPEVHDSLLRAIRKTNEKVSRAESIRRYLLVDTEFTVENGYLTPSLKLKRGKVIADYSDFVDDLYKLSETELAPRGRSVTPSPSEDRSH